MKTDQNSRQIGFGLEHGTETLLPLLVDPVTNELLIEIIPVAGAGTITTAHIENDENSRQVGAGITDDVDENITPITVEVINGTPCLRLDITT